MRKLVVAFVAAVAVSILGGGAALAEINTSTRASAASACSGHHNFGARAVDVAKTPDGREVLAQVSWGANPNGWCYLVLDEDATEVLRDYRTGALAYPTEEQAVGEVLKSTYPEVYECMAAGGLDCLPASILAPANYTARITVPAAAPSGRCADLIADGVYEWERCAWRGLESGDSNPVLTETEAQLLVNLIWAEVDAPGKPRWPPTIQINPADTHCSSPDGSPASCYEGGKHHIRLIEADLQTVLHETAHALVTNSSMSRACWSVDDDEQDTICSHHDLFRCAADYLYQEYAGLMPSGVCGTTQPSQRPTQWQKSGWSVWSVYGDGWPFTNLKVDWQNRLPPYQDSDAYFGVQCRDGDVDVYLNISEGQLEGQARIQYRVPISLVFLTAAEMRADELPHDLGNRVVRSLWSVSTNQTAAHMPDGDEEAFVNTLVRSEGWGLLVTIFGADGEPVGTFAFTNLGAERQVRPVTEECGWEWDQHGANSNESTWYTGEGDYGLYAQTRVEQQSRPSPYQSNRSWLTVQCGDDGLDVYLLFQSDAGEYLAGQTRHNGRIPVTHVVLTGEEHRDEELRDRAIESRGVHGLWNESISNRGAFMPEEHHVDFINDLVDSEDRYAYIWVEGEDGNPFGSFVFRSVNASPHVVPVTEACGWTWS